VRDIVRLESAVAAPIEGFGDSDGYPRLFEKVAALGYRLAAGHGFVDGNKRTAMLVMAQTLAWNDYNLDWPEPMQIIVLSLVGAGHLDQAGLLHALTVGYGFDPTKDDFP
jgi:death-on-curing protein